MLAQLDSVDPRGLRDLLILLLALATPAAAWAGILLGRRSAVRVEPQPLEVRPSRDLVERAAYERDQELIRERVAALEAGQRQMLAEINERLEEFRAESQQGIRRVHERMDRMPHELVALLRNTGVIK